MEIAAIQEEIRALPPDEQNMIAAFLTSLRMKRDGSMAEITRRLDDKDPANWRTWDEVKAELGIEHAEADS